ncbi:hypothetical protein [Paraburkholderia sp. J11-2]|uniref:hypothetical protein n=1 Tax=Paraburkholderia sp. J11-2 TaxID=2805431 RepID=UPI002AB7D7B1|nr:hypothetical protein [Paraburkholderia sp. J11-2]
MKWYIDAWSPTDGRAFASHRVSGDPWRVDAEDPVMLAAPTFEARPVPRAIAFGAVHRGMQEQFSLQDGTEHAFESLEQLRSYVRRIYGGSGPGTMGSGDDGGPEPDGDGPLVPPDGDWLRFLYGPDAPIDSGYDTSMAVLLATMEKNAHHERLFSVARLLPHRSWEAACRLLIIAAKKAFDAHMNANALELVRVACLINKDAAMKFAVSHYPDLDARSSSAYHGDWFDRRSDARLPHLHEAHLPKRFASMVDLPAKVATLLDAVTYLSADRRYIVNAAPSLLWPLIVALAACSQAQATSVLTGNGYDWRRPFRARCEAFIATWLPSQLLPDELEEAIHTWSRRDPKDQRGLTDAP